MWKKLLKKLTNLLGIESWKIIEIEPKYAKVHGKEVNHTIKIEMGDFRDLRIESLQSVKGNNVYDEHLQRKGESLHHIAIKVPEHNLMDVLTQLTKKGGQVIQTGRV